VSAVENVVHGIDVVALVKYLRAFETHQSRKQAFMWETKRLSSMSRSEVEKAMRAEWERTAK
jgi:hypothetical protein